MHTHKLSDWQHEHDFAITNKKGERRTKIVLILTFFTMLLEIAAGIIFGSMALLADGWHMATHVAAFMITLFAYRYSRQHTHDETFAFSTAKVSFLGGFASSIALGVVALIMLIEALQRLYIPHAIHFNEAIAVASFGLAINFISAVLLQSHDHDHHSHGQADHKHAHHHDHNLKAAYAHVLADALTSVLAIIALLAAKYYGWLWLDPVMAMVGALVILRWSIGLVKETAPILLDESIPPEYKAAIITTLESDADNRISDLHIWRVGPHHYAIIVALVTDMPQAPDYYKKLLSQFKQLKHITIEVNHCPGEA
ncbi:MAG: CDF family Co(II)/Ni(II) efflux transporter DmeF [Methylococcaceae bacterium]|nr:CDF family Co(II)/Ni(II) efflux transporter DmeF [Methylococcaceae bacterium]